MRNFYKVLGLSEQASPEEIKSSYLKLVKQWHPDRNPHDPLSNEMMKMYNEAYDVLSDPQKKHAYDKSIGIVFPETEQRNKNRTYKSDNAYSNTGTDFSVVEPLFDIRWYSRMGPDAARQGPFLSRLLISAYYRFDVLVAAIVASVFLYLSVTYQEKFFTPLFFLVIGVTASLVVYSIIRIALVIFKALKEYRGE